MRADIYPLQMLLLTVSGRVNRHQAEVIAYLVEENRGLKEPHGGRALRLTDDERRRLAAKALHLFLENGRVPIHNNACEVSIRPVAVGRRNWLFAGSVRGGHAAATIYTLVESCKLAKVDPHTYLADILLRVATHPASRVDELVPANWKSLTGHAPT